MYDATPLLKYLKDSGILYKVDWHPRTTTALQTAEAEHVSGKHFAKTVVLVAGDRKILAVLPADLKVDVERLARLTGKADLRLASESDFSYLFPNCEVGAMPPFGNLCTFEVLVDDDLATAAEVTFNACTHLHTITVSGEDFLRATGGKVVDFNQ